jgi:hypothetical protein
MPATFQPGFGRIGKTYPAPARRPPPTREMVRAYGTSHGWHLHTPWHSLTQPWRPTVASATGETAEMRRAYPEMAFREAAVKSPLMARVWEVGCLDLQVLPADKANTRDREIAEGYKAALTKMNGGLGLRAAVVEIGLAAAIVGHSLSEMPLNADLDQRGKWRGKRMIKAVKAKRPGTYRLVTDDYANLTGVRTPDQDKDEPAHPPDRFIHYPWLSLYGDVEGVSDLRAAFRAFSQMDAVVKLRHFFHDKLAGGFSWVSGVSDLRASAVKSILAEMRGCGFAVLGPDEELHMAEMALGSQVQFNAYIEDLRKEMFIAVAGSHLPFAEGANTNVAGSSAVQRNVSTLPAWVLAADIGSLLTAAAHLWVDENYLGADYPTVKLGGIDPAERDRYVERALKGNQIADLSASEFYEQSGLSPPKDESDKLPKATPPAGPPGGAGAFPFDERGWTLEPVDGPAAFGESDYCGGKGGKPGPCPENKPLESSGGQSRGTIPDAPRTSIPGHDTFRNRITSPDQVAGVPKTKKARQELAKNLQNAHTEARNVLVQKYGTRNIESVMTPEEKALDSHLFFSLEMVATGRGRDGPVDLGPVADEHYARHYRNAVKALDRLRQLATVGGAANG